MNLTETPETVQWPSTHYVFLEKVGPLPQNAPQAWQQFHPLIAAIAEHNSITGFLSLYNVGSQVYRAGVSVAAPPNHLPEGLRYETFAGGTYCRFVLTGPYSQLAEATSRAYRQLVEQQVALRDDFSIENYISNPRNTPEAELKTEILFPLA